MVPGFRKLAGLADDRTIPVDAPWDHPIDEHWSNYSNYDDYKARSNLTKTQGYSDLSKGAKLKIGTEDAIDFALVLFIHNPTSKTSYIKDPSGLLDAAAIQKRAENYLTGKDDGHPSYGAFGFHNNDGEIYADGVEVFRDGEWGYEVTQALDQAQNNELKKNPPKVKVTRIRGKTAEGWRIDVSKPLKHYVDVGLAAAEKEAADLAKKGIRPDPFETFLNGTAHYPDALARKWQSDKGKDCPKCGLEGGHGSKRCRTCGTVGGHGCEMCSGEMD